MLERQKTGHRSIKTMLVRSLFRRTLLAPSNAAAFSASPMADVKKVGVIGLGLMGHGVAQTAMQAGFDVVGLETDPAFLQNGTNLIEGSLKKVHSRAVKKGKATQEEADAAFAADFGRFEGVTDVGALADCDLVIEAIVEDYAVKNPLYATLGELCKPSTVFATNTSSLSVTQMGDASGRPENMIGLHFFNPVQMMKLVEVVRTEHTSDAAFQLGHEYCKAIGKVSISCKDTPGFVVNRLLVPYIAQAQLMVERGDATAEDVDIAMRLGTGHPMGPIHLGDYVGHDTCKFILEGWVKNFPEEPNFVVPDILLKLNAAGRLGRKSGEGFYKWENTADTAPSGPGAPIE